jgi:hypothetical protein
MFGMPPESTIEPHNSDIEITLSEVDNNGRYEARLGDTQQAGELSYSRLDDGNVSADHTGVPDALRGRGIGKALVERLVGDARAGGFRIVPSCPFVSALSGKHPEWSDVIRQS